MTPASRKGRPRLATALLAVILGTAAPSFAQQPSPAPTPTPEPSKIQVGGYVDVYYGYNFNKVDPLLRSFDVLHNTFSLSAAEVNFTKVPTADSRVGFRTDLFFGKAADLTAAFEPEAGRQGDLQARAAGLREPADRQGPVGRRQVRDPHRGRGDRVPGQLELHPLGPLRLRHPVLPPRRARHRPGVGQAEPERVPRERLEQRERARRREDVRDRGDPEADGLPDLDRELHGRQGSRPTSTPATSSTPP